ncbi:hypothetical protein [uncultured Corynebacterium sp.]|uniref:hypothetical protein n=1 Tax=uncultured Corynebacterium sp. TaxID=159447 RepID=UPI0025E386B7|nr:hypothetical protein [uncultured Corynebacterium sp.]
MGRIVLLLLIVVTVVLLWKAFGPSTWRKELNTGERPAIKGPDDDEQFLWELDKQRFKERRERERRDEVTRRQEPPADPEGPAGRPEEGAE